MKSRRFSRRHDRGRQRRLARGFFCPCHGSQFDFAGRVFKAVPAPINLKVPPYRFLSEFRIEIGAHDILTLRGIHYDRQDIHHQATHGS